MSKQAYLTIDDSPGQDTDALTTFLQKRNVPALLFCRGDALQANPDPIIRAIANGFVIGNHTFHHPRCSGLSFAQVREEILQTEALIDRAHATAAMARPGKYFRFSYLDRGCGAWVVDFDTVSPLLRADLQKLFWEGLNFCDQQPPAAAQRELKAQIQEFLKSEGFTVPFTGITHSWWQDTEIAQAADCFFTFSTSDWMLTRRHLEKNWPYKTLDDLKARIDHDPWLADPDSREVILLHDQAEILGVACELVDHFLQRGFRFMNCA